MSFLTDAPDYEQRFLDTYGRGTVVEVYISKIIQPSQIVTTFNGVFSGRLSLMDIAKAMPEAEQLFRAFKVGDIITCVVLDVDLKHKIVKLSQKELTDQANDQTLWHSITRHEEMAVNLVRELHQYYLVRTGGGIYGIISRDFDREQISKEPFRIKEKLDSVRLLSLIPADSDGNSEHGPEKIAAAYRSIDEEFRSYRVFVASLLGRYAKKDEHELIKRGFEVDPLIFSKEISLLQPLYLEFDRNNIAYENNLKNKALPYFFPGEPFNKDTEKRILEKLGALKYWFKLIYNTREIPGKNNPTTSLEFTLYNEEVNIYVTVIKSGNEDPRLVVKNLNLGRDWSKTTERKKSFSRNGAFLFSSSIILLGPYTSLPFGIIQQDVLDYLELKTRCLEVAQEIKKASGEILRQEGYTLGIIDRFLEYQLKLLESQKGEAFFVSKFTQIPSNTDGITLRINPEVEPDFDNDAIVNVRVKRPSLKETQEEEYSWVGDAKFESSPAGSQITLSKDIEMKALAKGFYLDKKVSKRNLNLQRDIIKDFLEKKLSWITLNHF